MAIQDLPREKINIRSPFFITADSEGSPDLSTDCPVDISQTPVDIPSPTDPVGIPEEHQQPPAITETVECGTTVNIGTDVGTRRYNIEVGSVTGNVTVDYTVNTPISITGFWSTTIPDFSSTGYVGNDDFEQDLLDAGISAGSMNLTSGVATGSVTVNKTAASPSTVTILVSAPLPTDDYSLTFNCPSAPAIVPDPTPPVSQILADPGNSKLIENIPIWGLGQQLVTGSNVKLEINDTVVSESLDFRKLYYFSDYDPVTELGIQVGNMRAAVGIASYAQAVRYDKSTYFVDGQNKIVFTITYPGGRDGTAIDNFQFFRGGLFHYQGQWEYAKPTNFSQLGGEIGRYPVGVNNVNYFKNKIKHGVSNIDANLQGPVKVIFYYDTHNTLTNYVTSQQLTLLQKTEGLTQDWPTRELQLMSTDVSLSTLTAHGRYGGGFDVYFTQYGRGNINKHSLLSFGTQRELK